MTDQHSPLYARAILAHMDDSKAALQRMLSWSRTPWMVDAFTGSVDSARSRAVTQWLHNTLGEPLPAGSQKALHECGRWRMGSVTFHGMTWVGFTTRADMEQFLETWGPRQGVCVSCYSEGEVYRPACSTKPEDMTGQPIGMFHCPECAAMLLAGAPHGDVCKACDA